MVFIKSLELSKENKQVFINIGVELYMVIWMEYQLMVLLKIVIVLILMVF